MPRAPVEHAVRETTGPLQETRDPSRRPGRRELVCPTCGYMIVLDHEPSRCPMCGGEEWDFPDWRPFSGR